MESTGADIFISYKRSDGGLLAENICLRLKEKGFHNIFFDKDAMREGPFDSQIEDAIKTCTDFIILLTHDALECFEDPKAWVPIELELAVRNGCHVIPIVTAGWNGYDETFVERFPSVSKLENIRLTDSSTKTEIPKIVEWLKTPPLAIELIRTDYIGYLSNKVTGDILRAFMGYNPESVPDDLESKLIQVRVTEFGVTDTASDVDGVAKDDDNDAGDGASEENGQILSPYNIADNLHQFVIFCGESGTGKTTMLTQFIRSELEDWRTERNDIDKLSNNRLPVYLKLSDYDTSKGFVDSLVDLAVIRNIKTVIGKDEKDLVRKSISNYLKKGKLSIYLDAIDEAHVSKRKEIAEQIASFINANPNCKCVLATRYVEVAEHIDYIRNATKCDTYNMHQLDEAQKRKFLRDCSFLFESKYNWENTWDIINARVDFQRFSQNPMHLMMLASTFSQSVHDSNSLSLSMGHLYAEFIDRLLRKNKSQIENLGLSNNTKIIDVLTALARLSWDKGNIDCGISKDEVRDFVKYSYDITAEQFNNIIELVGNIHIIDNLGLELEFSHASFKEYFVALCLRSELLKGEMASHKDLLKTLVSSGNQNILKMIFEMFAEEESGKTKWSFKLASQILISENDKVGLHIRYMPEENLYTIDENAAIPEPHPDLLLMAKVTSGMKSSPDSPNGKDLVESFVLNHFVIFKHINPKGLINLDGVNKGFNTISHLSILFSCAGVLCSKKILQELCSPYWLRIWIMHYDDVRAVMGLSHLSEGEYLSDIPEEERSPLMSQQKCLIRRMIEQSSDRISIFNVLNDTQALMSKYNFTKSASRLVGYFREIFKMMTDHEIKLLYKSFDKQNYLGNLMLLYIDDADFFIKNFRLSEKYIHRQSLLIQSFISKNLNNKELLDFFLTHLKDLRDDNISAILGHYLRNNVYDEDLLEYIWKNAENNPKLYAGLIDLIPLELVSRDYAKKNYDIKVFDAQLRLNSANVRNGLDYYVLEVGEDEISIVVPDIELDYSLCKVHLPVLNQQDRECFDVVSDNVENHQYAAFDILKDPAVYLPTYGTVKSSSGEIEGIRYIAIAMKDTRVRAYTFNPEDFEKIERLRKSNVLLEVDGSECSSGGVYVNNKKIYRTRVLRLKNSGNLPVPTGRMMLYRDGAMVERIDESAAAPCTSMHKYFRPVKLEKSNLTLARTEVDFRVYAYEKNSIHLWTEKITSDIQGKTCNIIKEDAANADGLKYKVKNVLPIESDEHFVEITITDVNGIFIPLTGFLIRNSVSPDGDLIVENIPYVMRFSSGDKVRLRIISPTWIKKLSDSETRKRLIGQDDVFYRNNRVRVSAVDLIAHNPQASIVTIQPVGASDGSVEIEKEGQMQVLDANGKPMLLGIKPYMRNKVSSFADVRYLGYNEGYSLILLKADVDSTIVAGQYLQFAGSPNRYEIIRRMPVRLALKTRWRICDDVPLTGTASIDAFDEGNYKPLGFRYVLKPVDGSENEYDAMLLFSYISGTPESVIDSIGSICGIDLNQPGKEVKYIGVENISAVENVSDLYNFIVFLAGEVDALSCDDLGRANIVFYCPVVNNISPEFQELERVIRQFKVTNLSYTKMERLNDRICIPQCSTMIDGMYFRLNGEKEVHKVKIDTCAKVNAAVPLMALVIDDDLVKKNSGTLHFFRDETAETPAEVELKGIMGMVKLNQPHRYHNSICTEILDEIKRENDVNPALISFLIDKNGSGELMKYALSLNERRRTRLFNTSVMQYDLRIVVKNDQGNLIVFNPFADSTLFSRVDYMYCSDVDLNANDIIILEHNGKITKIESNLRLPELGYLEGLILSVGEGGDTFVKVKDRRMLKDHYFNSSCSVYQPSVGDRVTFLPNKNTHIGSSLMPVAEKIKLEGNGVMVGKVSRLYTVPGHRGYQKTHVVIKDEAGNVYDALLRHSELSKVKVGTLLTFVCEDMIPTSESITHIISCEYE